MNRKELVTQLELVSRALAKNDLVQIFKCFTFDMSTVRGYDDKLGIVAPCSTEKAFGVDGDTFLGLLKNSHSEEVELEFEGHDLIIKSGRSTFKLPYHEKDEFLFEEPTGKWAQNFAIDEGFINGIRQCLMTVSRDDTQRALLGVYLSLKPKHITMYSSDGDAITRFTSTIMNNGAGTDEYILPTAFCETIVKLFEETEAKTATLKINQDWVRCGLDGYTVYGRLEPKADEPLDFAAEIKKTLKKTPLFVPLPKGLDQALSRARVVADPESAPTTLTVDKGRLKLLTEASRGIVRDVLSIKHEDVEAVVSAELMQRSLKGCTELAILENCVCFKAGDKLFQLLSNLN